MNFLFTNQPYSQAPPTWRFSSDVYMILNEILKQLHMQDQSYFILDYVKKVTPDTLSQGGHGGLGMRLALAVLAYIPGWNVASH